ncbi:MAG: hypothetical protein SGJ18_05870 [Pseudomonadota bacterium]|nr:hypothetical protein [Pseudomonadota bacterium]
MNTIIKKAPINPNWWQKLALTLKWHKNSGVPLSEKYWQNLNDKIMSQIYIDDKKISSNFVDKNIDKKNLPDKTLPGQLSVEI